SRICSRPEHVFTQIFDVRIVFIREETRRQFQGGILGISEFVNSMGRAEIGREIACLGIDNGSVFGKGIPKNASQAGADRKSLIHYRFIIEPSAGSLDPGSTKGLGFSYAVDNAPHRMGREAR